VLYAGGGVVHAEASAELTALARRFALPVTTTLMALGAFPASDPQWLGMLGMHGTRPANWAMDEADLIVAVGARFDDRVTGQLASFAQQAAIVHVDVDAAEIGKNVAAHVPVVGDARRALSAMHGALAELDPDASRLDEWWARIDAWRAAHPPRDGRARRRDDRPRGRAGCAAGGHAGGTRSSPPTSASTRCGRPTACASSVRGAG
jgi:acetolactate synthase-1/2/3 large subunit